MREQILQHIVLIGVALGSESCSDTIIRDGNIGSTSALYTKADVRIVTERPHLTQPGHTVICTEPNPDVAKALSTASQLSGKAASGPEVAVNFASAEAAAELAGRTTALLDLRDGLYKACEAYANGAVGDLAYLLVLNRYRELMPSLFLGQDVQGSAAVASIQPDFNFRRRIARRQRYQDQRPTREHHTFGACPRGCRRHQHGGSSRSSEVFADARSRWLG